jgi:hypothetical protein
VDIGDLKFASRFETIVLFGAIALDFANYHTPLRAQALQRLHVRSFAMSTDNSNPQVGQTVHLTITAHLDEQLSELDNVTLPNLTGFDVQGDERTCSSSLRGTDYTENVVMVPNAPGNVTVPSATLVAVDATDGKPNRFATNSLHFVIGEATVPHFAVGGEFLLELFWNMVKAFVILGALALGAFFAIRYLARPRTPKAPSLQPAFAPAVPAAPAPPVEDFWSQYRKLVDALTAEPDRPRALAVRHALRYALGAHEKETLADLVRRNAAGDHPQTIAALRAIERACFCEDAEVTRYVEESLPFLKI